MKFSTEVIEQMVEILAAEMEQAGVAEKGIMEVKHTMRAGAAGSTPWTGAWRSDAWISPVAGFSRSGDGLRGGLPPGRSIPAVSGQLRRHHASQVGGQNDLQGQDIAYHCAIADPERFSERVRAIAWQHLADLYQELVFVYDGIAWIWKLIEHYFPIIGCTDPSLQPSHLTADG